MQRTVLALILALCLVCLVPDSRGQGPLSYPGGGGGGRWGGGGYPGGRQWSCMCRRYCSFGEQYRGRCRLRGGWGGGWSGGGGGGYWGGRGGGGRWGGGGGRWGRRRGSLCCSRYGPYF